MNLFLLIVCIVVASQPQVASAGSDTAAEKAQASSSRESSATSETSLDLQCTPQSAPSGETKDQVVSVIVSVQGSNWQVTHVTASGARYERNAQYSIQGLPNFSWEGASIKHPHLKMVGHIFTGGSGNYTYVETLYDAKQGGAQVNETRSFCKKDVSTSAHQRCGFASEPPCSLLEAERAPIQVKPSAPASAASAWANYVAACRKATEDAIVTGSWPKYDIDACCRLNFS
jgi:hypothetical protein